jgi:hypothetical protein
MREEFKPQQLPAFPVKMTGPGMFAGVALPVGAEIEWAGMTLRDYFAAKAMAGLLASDVRSDSDQFATYAYKVADAMLEARQK